MSLCATLSKVMLVITDGNRNTGEYSPFAAAEVARGYEIDVYAVGVGSNVRAKQQQVSYGSSQKMVKKDEVQLLARCFHVFTRDRHKQVTS